MERSLAFPFLIVFLTPFHLFIMTITESVSTCFKKFNVRDGRARRSEYWYFHLFQFLIGLLFGLVVVIAFPV